MKKTVVLGSSPDPSRYSFRMVSNLVKHKMEVIPVGSRSGTIAGLEIIPGKPSVKNVHTISLYLGPDRQMDFYDYIISLKPERIIFNPGTYNPGLLKLAHENGIETVIDCALAMLAEGKY